MKYPSALFPVIYLLSGGIIFAQQSVTAHYTRVRVVQTSRNGDRLAEKEIKNLTEMTGKGVPVIEIFPEQVYQTILGIGGSFTESSAYVLSQIETDKRQQILESYFGPSGAAYSLARTHMGSCDFSLKNYSYAAVPGDTALSHFSIEEDLGDLIPMIRDAQNVSGASFILMASPWTAPPWMKDNDDWNGGALKETCYGTWARYFSRYIQAYRNQGIDIWGVTVENEPLGNGAQWESMIYTPRTMKDFVKYHLGPEFQEKDISTKILIYDQNRDHLQEWAGEILSDPETTGYVWGTAVHWYSSTFRWYPEVLEAVHEEFPEKHLIHTEGCIDSEVPVWQEDDWYWRKEATDWGYDWAPEQDKPLHPKYVPVYRYARDIIGGLNSWLVGWIDWNMVLDRQGGPNHANNWCIAPVLVDTETEEIYVTPLYDIMVHFSRYIRPGAVRIGVRSDLPEIMVTACRNENMELVVEILNQQERALDYQLKIDQAVTTIHMDGQALQTVIIGS